MLNAQFEIKPLAYPKEHLLVVTALPGSTGRQWSEQVRQRIEHSDSRAVARRKSVVQTLRDALVAAIRFVIGFVLTIISVGVGLVFYEVPVLVGFMMPYLLPVLMLPVVVLIGLIIVSFGSLLAAIGLL